MMPVIQNVGFIGLGNVGAKLAGSLLIGGHDLTVCDLDREAAAPLLERGASWADSPAEVATRCDLAITCLPNPAASAEVVEGDDGLLSAIRAGSVWAEMSTTDEAEVRRLAGRFAEVGVAAADCPVSGGCHRAATGNISIFAGCDRPVFERLLPVLSTMGRQVLHTGPLGTASVLKVVTNYLATAHLAALTEALVTAAHRAGKQVHIWTVDDSESMEKLIDAGVDGIFTDRIDTLKAVLQHRSLWSPATQ